MQYRVSLEDNNKVTIPELSYSSIPTRLEGGKKAFETGSCFQKVRETESKSESSATEG